MKTIEERADEYVGHSKEIDEDVFVSALRDAYIKGAEDQKEEDERIRLKKSKDMTEAEFERETDFANWYVENGISTPTFSDAIEWERKRVLKDVHTTLTKIIKKPLNMILESYLAQITK